MGPLSLSLSLGMEQKGEREEREKRERGEREERERREKEGERGNPALGNGLKWTSFATLLRAVQNVVYVDKSSYGLIFNTLKS